MKKATLAGIIAILVIIGFMVLFAQKSQRGVKIVREGDRAPEFQLTTLDGKAVSLSSLRGKVVMVHFWATWCPPCVEEIPTLEQLNRSFTGKDLAILAVSVDEGGAGAVGQFMQKNGFTLPVLLNPDQSAARAYGTFKFPETYLLDREGVVRRKVIGAMDWTAPSVHQVIQEMLDGK